MSFTEVSQDIRGVAPGEEEHQLNSGHKHESFNGNSTFFCTSSLQDNKRRLLPYFCGALVSFRYQQATVHASLQ
ncbi:unnamed protein product [Sphagnum jensenii]|uniref:Uncharacterized protein n=1 Tax=Sphagnum jensenii TaxID=128206 RepID=A0ABP0X456_9BRYO